MSLYHKDIGIPLGIKTRFGTLRLQYSHHAKQAALNDNYGPILQPPKSLDTDKATVVEVEAYDGGTIKVVYRIPYELTTDLVLVVQPNGVVRTMWLNLCRDQHRTLDKGRYNRAGFTLIEVLVAMALLGFLTTTAFSLIFRINVAIVKADKLLKQVEQSQLVCTMVPNGQSWIYKCVAGKKLGHGTK